MALCSAVARACPSSAAGRAVQIIRGRPGSPSGKENTVATPRSGIRYSPSRWAGERCPRHWSKSRRPSFSSTAAASRPASRHLYSSSSLYSRYRASPPSAHICPTRTARAHSSVPWSSVQCSCTGPEGESGSAMTCSSSCCRCSALRQQKAWSAVQSGLTLQPSRSSRTAKELCSISSRPTNSFTACRIRAGESRPG